MRLGTIECIAVWKQSRWRREFWRAIALENDGSIVLLECYIRIQTIADVGRQLRQVVSFSDHLHQMRHLFVVPSPYRCNDTTKKFSMAVQLVVHFLKLLHIPPVGNFASLVSSSSIIATSTMACTASTARLATGTLAVVSIAATMAEAEADLGLSQLKS